MEENKMRNKFNTIFVVLAFAVFAENARASAVPNAPTVSFNYYDWQDTLAIPGFDNPQSNFSSGMAQEVNENNQAMIDQDKNGYGSQSMIERIKSKVMASMKLVKTPIDMVKAIIAMFNTGCDGLKGIIDCVSNATGMFSSENISYFTDFQKNLAAITGGSNQTIALSGGGVITTGETEGNAMIGASAAAGTSGNVAKVQKMAKDVQTGRNLVSLVTNDPKVEKLGKDASDWAQQLQDNIDSAVSTRAAVQAMGEGIANQIRQHAVSHRQVIDRLQGIMQNTAQTNELLSQIVEKSISSDQAVIDQTYAEYQATMTETREGTQQFTTQIKGVSNTFRLGAGAMQSFDLP
jgi:hypothetical protein